ncbi:9327_t:CDS:1, partial [Scutellospora calospora]
RQISIKKALEHQSKGEEQIIYLSPYIQIGLTDREYHSEKSFMLISKQ